MFKNIVKCEHSRIFKLEECWIITNMYNKTVKFCYLFNNYSYLQWLSNMIKIFIIPKFIYFPFIPSACQLSNTSLQTLQALINKLTNISVNKYVNTKVQMNGKFIMFVQQIYLILYLMDIYIYLNIKIINWYLFLKNKMKCLNYP